MKFSRYIVCIYIILLAVAIQAGGDETGENPVYKISVQQPFDQVYRNVYKSLEDASFWVIFEANIGKNLARNAERWGEEYNRNRFEEVKTMVICNPYYANQVLNQAPDLIAFCPMGVTLLHKSGITTVMFERLLYKSKDSPVADMMWEIDNTIISAIENAVSE